MAQNVRVLDGGKFSIRIELNVPEGTSLRYLKQRFLDPLLQPSADVVGSVYVKPKQGRDIAILVLCEANRSLMTEEMVLLVRRHVEQNVTALKRLYVELEAIGWPVEAPGGWAGLAWPLVGVGLVAGYMFVRVLMDPKHARRPATERSGRDALEQLEYERRERDRGGGGVYAPQYTRRRAPERAPRLFDEPRSRRPSRRREDIEDLNRHFRPDV